MFCLIQFVSLQKLQSHKILMVAGGGKTEEGHCRRRSTTVVVAVDDGLAVGQHFQLSPPCCSNAALHTYFVYVVNDDIVFFNMNIIVLQKVWGMYYT